MKKSNIFFYKKNTNLYAAITLRWESGRKRGNKNLAVARIETDAQSSAGVDACTQVTGFTGTKVQILTAVRAMLLAVLYNLHTVCLLYWLHCYKSTNTDAVRAVLLAADSRREGEQRRR